MFNRKKNSKRNVSRVHRNHEDGLFHVDGMGISVLCVIVIGALAVTGYKVHKQHEALQNQPQTQQLSTHDSNLIPLKIKTYPKTKILANGTEIGKTNSRGNYYATGVSVGTKLVAKYGSVKSAPVMVTKARRNKVVRFDFSYISRSSAQRFLNNMYSGVTSLANDNDQTSNSGSLEDFFTNGSRNSSYQDLFKWAKDQYKTFQENDTSNLANSDDDGDDTEEVEGMTDMSYTENKPSSSSSDNTKSNGASDKSNKSDAKSNSHTNKKSQDTTASKTKPAPQPEEKTPVIHKTIINKPHHHKHVHVSGDSISAVHFVVHVKATSLNRDGTANVEYTVKNDFAGKKHDHISVFKWNGVMKRVGHQWKMVSTGSNAHPISSYDD